MTRALVTTPRTACPMLAIPSPSIPPTRALPSIPLSPILLSACHMPLCFAHAAASPDVVSRMCMYRLAPALKHLLLFDCYYYLISL